MRERGAFVILDRVRCVIVDDNPGVVAAVRALLERDGVTVAGVAAAATDALRVVAETRPDVALVDIDLGGESDYSELVEASPAAGFLAKSDLSAGAIRALLSAPRGT